MKQYENKPIPSHQLMKYFTKLGEEWESIGVYEQAEDYYRKAKAISVQLYGNRHSNSQDLSMKIGGTVMQQSA